MRGRSAGHRPDSLAFLLHSSFRPCLPRLLKKHSTSNVQGPPSEPLLECWAFNVECFPGSWGRSLHLTHICPHRIAQDPTVTDYRLKPPHTPEPNVQGGAGRAAAAAIGAPRVVNTVDPTAAAQHPAAQWPDRSPWIRIGGLTIRRRIPIPTPLSHIPRHVV